MMHHLSEKPAMLSIKNSSQLLAQASCKIGVGHGWIMGKAGYTNSISLVLPGGTRHGAPTQAIN